MSREINQRRAASLLVLLGSILFVAVIWNYPGPNGNGRERSPIDWE